MSSLAEGSGSFPNGLPPGSLGLVERQPDSLIVPDWSTSSPGVQRKRLIRLQSARTCCAISSYTSLTRACPPPLSGGIARPSPSMHTGFDGGLSVSDHPIISRLFRSFFLQRPPARRLLPSWSRPKVLQTLSRPPFEPLAAASLLNVTIKTRFLVAVASGQRRSTIHAPSLAAGHIRFEPGQVRLIPEASFIAKNQTTSSGPCEIVLPSIPSISSVTGDKLWCPVRALKWYLDRTKTLRNSTCLFIAMQAPHQAASAVTISR